jgi:outer membrane biosynthesis protein TonB
MRTHILIAAALALSASTVHAAPRSLSTAQPNPVQTAPEAAKPAEAPVFKVQSTDEVKPSEQPQAAPQPVPVPTPAQAAPAAAQAAPAPTQAAPAPGDAGSARSAATTPADTKVAPTAKPVRHAQRKQRRQMTAEQQANRELRSIERNLGAMGAAAAISAISYAIPLALYW